MRLSPLLLATVNACTRMLYETGDGNYIVGRSMDWFECLGSDLWSFPRGMKRDGGTGPKALAWTSKYGSVVVDAYFVLHSSQRSGWIRPLHARLLQFGRGLGGLL